MTQKNLTLITQIQKLAKGLQKFTLNDISNIISCDDNEIRISIEELIKNNVIKEISNNEYLYIKFHNITSEINTEKGTNSETSNTKRKSLGRYPVDKIISIATKKYNSFNEVQVSDNKEEMAIYNSLPDKTKKYIVRIISIFKATQGLRLGELSGFLKELRDTKPELKISLTTFYNKKKRYLKYGIKGLIPEYKGHKKETCVPKEMYDVFKQIYLSKERYSLATATKMLTNYGFEKDLIPSSKTFSRLLNKEFTKEEIEQYRTQKFELPNFKTEIKIKKPTSLYDNFLETANAYLKSIESSKTQRDICYRGYIVNHLIPYFKDKNFSDFTQDDISNFTNDKLKEGFAAASVKRFLACFSVLLKFNNTDLKFNFSQHRNNLLSSNETGVLTPIEIDEIKNNNDLASLFIISLGINVGELLGLNYSDIDFKNRTIKINKIFYNDKLHEHRKKYKIRTLKIPKVLLEKLDKTKSGRIFKTNTLKNYEKLLNTHVKLMLDKNIQLHIIYKNLGMENLNEFETRFNHLLNKKLDDNFEILE